MGEKRSLFECPFFFRTKSSLFSKLSAVLHCNNSSGRLFQAWMTFTEKNTFLRPTEPVTWIPPPHHNRFTALFPGPPGWAGARRELLDFMDFWTLPVTWIIYMNDHVDQYLTTERISASRQINFLKVKIHRVKWHHSNLWSQYDLYVLGQHGILCKVKWWRFVTLFE